MSNLIRGRKDILLQQITGSEIGQYYDADGNKHLVVKPAGLDIPGVNGANVVIKNASAGQKKVVTLTPAFLWSGERNYIFELTIIKKGLRDGRTDHQMDIPHTYNFKLNNFVTTTDGTLATADKQAIVDGLVAAINSDTRLYAGGVNTGTAVVASNNSNNLVLTSNDYGVDFEVKFETSDFTMALTTPFKKPTLTNDLVAQLFSIKPWQDGQIVPQPVPGVEYALVTINMKTKGYDNVSPSSINAIEEQVINIYCPAASITSVQFAAWTDSNTNANTMADTVGTKAKTFKEVLQNVFGSFNVMDK